MRPVFKVKCYNRAEMEPITNDRDCRSAVSVRTLAVGGNPRQKSENK